jgi:hypothetical protein
MTGTDVALDHYMQPSRRAAEAAIGGHSGDGAKKGVGSPPENLKKPRCEGEDLNLHGSYPASTSIKSRSKFPQDSAKSSKSKTAATGRSKVVSGDRPPNVLVPALEALSLAAERAFGRRFVEVSSITRRHRKGVA